MEKIIGLVLALSLGVFVGYRWRNHISQQRRARFEAERFVREQRSRLEQEIKAKASSGDGIELG